MNPFVRQQKKVLQDLLEKASDTVYGRRYDFKDIKTYEDFSSRIPMVSYSDIEPEIEQVKSSEPDILWPGIVDKFAVSAGTTGKGKHLPLTSERLKSDKRFMRKVIFSYLKRNPDPGLFLGSHVSLPGSIETVLGKNRNTLGEISGFLASLSPAFLKPFQVVPPSKLSVMPWKPKFTLCLDRALKKDVRVISAVPSWTLIFFRKALEISGKKTIRELWPNLRLIVSGGVALSSYKDSLLSLCEGLPVSFLENYGSSEGYFSFTDTPEGEDMKLIGDNGIFYEWLPYENGNIAHAKPMESANLVQGKKYVLCVSTNAGLWRYLMNDVIEITQTNPPRIRVSGRVSDMFDQYGEALYFSEAKSVLDSVLKKRNIEYERLHIGYLKNPSTGIPGHVWFIISDYTSSGTTSSLLRDIDHQLCLINRHYAIRRETGALELPKVFFIHRERFNEWILEGFKSNAQTKLSNFLSAPEITEKFLQLSVDL